MREHVPVIFVLNVISRVKFEGIIENVQGFKVEIDQEDGEENVTCQVELGKSWFATPFFWDHEIVEEVSSGQHKEFNEEWYVEDLFLLWSTEKDKVICVDKSQYGQAQPEWNQFTCRKLKEYEVHDQKGDDSEL